MFLRFFSELRDAKVPVSLREYLMLMEAMDQQVIGLDVDDFYYLSRTALVKDERTFRLWLRHPFRGLRPPSGKGHGGKPRFAYGRR